MTDILARMRDAADTHNIAPIVSKLVEEGFSCAIVCDTPGKAFSILEEHFPHLLSIAVELDTREEMYERYPEASVFL